MAYQSYAVANKGKPNEQRELVYFGASEAEAGSRVKQAIASGFEYGYIKENGATIAFVNERSFTMKPLSG